MWSRKLVQQESQVCSQPRHLYTGTPNFPKSTWAPDDLDGFNLLNPPQEVKLLPAPEKHAFPKNGPRAVNLFSVCGETALALRHDVTFTGYTALEVETLAILQVHARLGHIQRPKNYYRFIQGVNQKEVDLYTGFLPDKSRTFLATAAVGRRISVPSHVVLGRARWESNVTVTIQAALELAQKNGVKRVFLGLRYGIFKDGADYLPNFVLALKTYGFCISVVDASYLVQTAVDWEGCQFLLAESSPSSSSTVIEKIEIPCPALTPQKDIKLPKKRLIHTFEKGWWEARNSSLLMMRAGSPLLIKAAWDFLQLHPPSTAVRLTLYTGREKVPGPLELHLNWETWEKDTGNSSQTFMEPITPLLKETVHQIPNANFTCFLKRYRAQPARRMTRALRLAEDTEKEEKKTGIVASQELVEWAWGFPPEWADAHLFHYFAKVYHD